jgi:hypothetical protein
VQDPDPRLGGLAHGSKHGVRIADRPGEHLQHGRLGIAVVIRRDAVGNKAFNVHFGSRQAAANDVDSGTPYRPCRKR